MLKKLSRAQIVMIVVFLAAIIYFVVLVISNKDDGKLRASGTIEAVEVNVSAETSGKVKEVLVEEGQAVKIGDALLNLDPSLLDAQRAVASAQLDSAKAGVISAQNALNTAKSQYQISLETALAQDRKNRVKDWFSKDPNQFQPARLVFLPRRTTPVRAGSGGYRLEGVGGCHWKTVECQYIC